jgi:hypothetical protein
MSDTLVNKIAASGLITIKPEEWAPTVHPDFRAAVKAHDWSAYDQKVLCVFCSTEAIIPNWAFMLVTSMASPFAKTVFFGSPDQWIHQQILTHIEQLDVAPYIDQRVIIKGCSDRVAIGPDIYMALTGRLLPVVQSLMFGEPCSTVPVYKRPKSV